MMSDAQFASDAGFVQRDLDGLKRLLEKLKREISHARAWKWLRCGVQMRGDLQTRVEVHRYLIVSAMFLFFVAPLRFPAQPVKSKTSERSIRPVLVNACVVTENVNRLVRFYEPILGQKAKWSGDDYAEFATGVGVLAIFSSSAQEEYIPRSAEPARIQSVILEFNVADVDAEYRCIRGMVKTWVKPPTTQPWGTRSIYFHDPDGNLVDFYAPAS